MPACITRNCATHCTSHTYAPTSKHVRIDVNIHKWWRVSLGRRYDTHTSRQRHTYLHQHCNAALPRGGSQLAGRELLLIFTQYTTTMFNATSPIDCRQAPTSWACQYARPMIRANFEFRAIFQICVSIYGHYHNFVNYRPDISTKARNLFTELKTHFSELKKTFYAPSRVFFSVH